MANFGNMNIRLVESNQEPILTEDDDVLVEGEEAQDKDIVDAKGNIIKVEHDDGSVTIAIDGNLNDGEKESPKGWFANLVDKIDDGQLGSIADDLLRGIEEDIESRQQWITDRANGIKLLGLKLEIPNQGGSSDGAPVEGMSMVRHPLLMEAVLRFQANARSEFLPTDGPTKIRDDSNNPTLAQDQLAQAFQKDMNHYLTVTASEYYPDTDQMFLLLGFGGTTFKKIYFCPLRNRPASETVDADDLIVNNSATDLQNARRITHRIYMRPSLIKRMQLIGAYRDTDLPDAHQVNQDAVQQAKDNQQGISRAGLRPNNIDREIYECYCELDLPGFAHKWNGKTSGLEVPYVVTIDVTSRTVLSIVRNYKKSSDELPVARKTFVKYTYVPGFGFYDIGLLHILGNTTNAATAGWREMLDAGMFANFPGFLYADSAGRQNSMVFRVPPGGGAPVKTGGMPIQQAIMPLPYKEPGPAMTALIQNMVETGQRVGGTAELMVGEGKQDAPVGTTLALMEQATKVLNSIHKRIHTSQAQELQMIVECFREHPDSFWKHKDKKAFSWDQETFDRALDNYDLIPQADPNTSSQSQRIMKILGVKQLQQQSPNLYDPVAVDTAALQAMGWSNPDQFFRPENQRNQLPPEVQKEIAKLGQEDKKLALENKKVDADIGLGKAKLGLDEQRLLIDSQPEAAEQQDPHRELEVQAKLIAAQASLEDNDIKMFDAHVDAENRQADRESRERLALAKIVQDALKGGKDEGSEAKGFAKQIMTPDFIDRLKEDDRVERAHGGRVTARDDALKSSIDSLVEELRAEKEIVRDEHTGRVIGVRRKLPSAKDDLKIEYED